MNLVEEIIKTNDSVLINANPGTGKTYLLSKKFVHLIKSGVEPKNILCLTFTNKAKLEMEDRIIKFLEEEKLSIDYSELNIFTFHSYALDFLEEGKIISTNFLRFIIFDYLKKNEVFNYEDKKLVESIVPKIENLLRYLKGFGVLPSEINKEKVKELIGDFERKSGVIKKADLENLLDFFVEVFELYEEEKRKKGLDYSDLLIDFLKLEKKPFFEFVLVDELQDVNNLEARIALESGKNFFAVGDKKQAIFGFQGGSIENFNLFKEKKPTEFNLKENRRSTQEILDFAGKDYSKKSLDEETKNELIGLKSYNGSSGEKVKLVSTSEEELNGTIFSLINKLEGETAVLVRTNSQLTTLAKELELKGIEFSSTQIASSLEAKKNIITFIKAVFSEEASDLKNAFFTPFYPISLKKAFSLIDKNISLEEILEESPEFKQIRENQESIESISKLFEEIIYPISVIHGEEYLLTAQSLHNTIKEAILILREKTLRNLILYLEASNLESSAIDKKSRIILTTVHKAKGIGFRNVIYVPKKMSDKSGFMDYLIEKILEEKELLTKSEIEEEEIRIDFVAYTRAKEKLFIVTEKETNYLNEFTEKIIITPEKTSKSYQEKQKKAYNLFINKNYEEAKKMLEEKEEWIVNFIKNHFDKIDRISFSKLTTNAYEYLTKYILNLGQSSFATKLGSNVHSLIEHHLKGEKVSPTKEEEPYFSNALELIKEIKKEYPILVQTEYKIEVPLSEIINTNEKIMFKGIIDAVYKNNKEEYLLVDWKTSKNTSSATEYRRQLELYKQTYSKKEKIDLKKIRVMIGFIGLRETINNKKIELEADFTQPQSRVYQTIQKYLNKFIEWKTNPQVFVEELLNIKTNEPLIRAIKEEIEKAN